MSDLTSSFQDLAARSADSGGAYRIRRATVIATSPVTVQFADGTSIAGIPYLYSYYPILNDIVRVELDGPAPCILGLAPGQSPWHTLSSVAPFTTGGGTNGNGTYDNLQYKVENLECTYKGHFTLGSTTNWGAGVVAIWLPFNTSATQPFGPLGWAYAYDQSRGQQWSGAVFMPGNGVNSGSYVMSTSATGLWVGQWQVQVAPNNYPFTSGESWTTFDEIRWDIRYQVAPL